MRGCSRSRAGRWPGGEAVVVPQGTVYTGRVRYVGSDHCGGKEPLRDVSKHILPSKAPVETGHPLAGTGGLVRAY